LKIIDFKFIEYTLSYKGVGRKISRGKPTEKDRIIAKNTENGTIKPLSGRPTEKGRKK